MTSADRIREHVKHLRLRIERLRAWQTTTLEEYAADLDRRDVIEHNFPGIDKPNCVVTRPRRAHLSDPGDDRHAN